MNAPSNSGGILKLIVAGLAAIVLAGIVAGFSMIGSLVERVNVIAVRQADGLARLTSVEDLFKRIDAKLDRVLEEHQRLRTGARP